ncbi:MAG: Ni/Fe-hydrogenase cytochrome b subunit [Deltaproteobacteria bacterium]|nr:Ni/Fe-hydrogenase cytochrome b subunit [Deltaproteobacteria bacterium]
MTRRLTALKTVLWLLAGVLGLLTVVRFLRGLGATTALTDTAPWGFWIAFDVMSGVALAAGGFVVAATVYIFGRERYRAFARPAILTAFLGYAAVAVGLLYDLGLPWHILNPVAHPQHHSVLFEVAMCVMLYLTVLFLEFSPVILEHPRLQRPLLVRIHHALKKVTIPLVIAGIVLSTLHQSSLGSLFLIAPYRLHPLWYSPYIWVLFFTSAVALGLAMVISESFFSAWLFGHKPRRELLANLGRAASFVLLLYVALRLGDLAARGQLARALEPTGHAALFWLELGVSALLPALLLQLPRVRSASGGLFGSAALIVFGMIGYRFDVCIVAFARPEDMPYFPSWMEIAVSVGIVAAAMIVFVFFVEHLRVYPPERLPSDPCAERAGTVNSRLSTLDAPPGPETVRPLLVGPAAAPRRYSLALVLGASLAVALLPATALFGEQVQRTPVAAPRMLDVLRLPASGRPAALVLPGDLELRTAGLGPRPALLAASRPERRGSVAEGDPGLPGGHTQGEPVRALLLDADRDGRTVLFAHDAHVERAGGETSCGRCHHQNLPFDRASSCGSCHADMFLVSDTFRHQRHVERLGGNASCTGCHDGAEGAKTRAKARACDDCHRDMVVADSVVAPRAGGLDGHAVGYMDAVHGLCVSCHEREVAARPGELPDTLADCGTCHGREDPGRLRRQGPYLPHSARRAQGLSTLDPRPSTRGPRAAPGPYRVGARPAE